MYLFSLALGKTDLLRNYEIKNKKVYIHTVYIFILYKVRACVYEFGGFKLWESISVQSPDAYLTLRNGPSNNK